MKTAHRTSWFKLMAALLEMKIYCLAMNIADPSYLEIDEDRANAAKILHHLCDNWTPFRLGVADAEDCDRRCGKGFAILFPDRKRLICYTSEEDAEGYMLTRHVASYQSDDYYETACECGLVVRGSHKGAPKKEFTCEDVPYRIKAEKYGKNCTLYCGLVTIFVTRIRLHFALEWCYVGRTDALSNKVPLRGVISGYFNSKHYKKVHKCWCGLRAEQIEPSAVAVTPFVGMEYWLGIGFRRSKEIKKQRGEEIDLISKISGNMTRDVDVPSNEATSSSQSEVRKGAETTVVSRYSDAKYHDFFQRSRDTEAKTHCDGRKKKRSGVTERENLEIPDIDFLQLGVGPNASNSTREGSQTLEMNSLRIDKEYFHQPDVASNDKISEVETEALKRSKRPLQIAVGSYSQKMGNQSSPESGKEILEMDKKYLRLEICLGDQKTERKISGKLEISNFGNSNGDDDFSKSIDQSTTICNNMLKHGTDKTKASKYDDFLSMKLNSLDWNIKEVSEHHQENILSRSEPKKMRLSTADTSLVTWAPVGCENVHENPTQTCHRLIKPIPIVKIGKDEEGSRFNLKKNLIGDRILRSENGQATAFTNPADLMQPQGCNTG